MAQRYLHSLFYFLQIINETAVGNAIPYLQKKKKNHPSIKNKDALLLVDFDYYLMI